jgi:hypothetical protein
MGTPVKKRLNFWLTLLTSLANKTDLKLMAWLAVNFFVKCELAKNKNFEEVKQK